MTIRSFNNIYPNIADKVYVDETALVIGDVTLGEDASIWPMTVVRGDVNTITIGERTNIQDGSVLHVTHDGPYAPGGQSLQIANDVTVGHHVVLHGCVIEEFTLIGIASQVMDGAIIRARALVGAGSLVPPGKELEGGFLWVGRPVKQVRPLSDRELEYFEYSSSHYVKLKNRHLGLSSQD